jgi:hypothetical protein
MFMPFILPPTKRTTSAQWIVVAWILVAILVLAGAVAFYFAVLADLPEQSASLRRIGFLSLGLAVIVWTIKRLIVSD